MKSKELKDNKRKSDFLQVAPANYLIVCEGKQTEPNYFNGLKQAINKKYGNKVDVNIHVQKITKKIIALQNEVLSLFIFHLDLLNLNLLFDVQYPHYPHNM